MLFSQNLKRIITEKGITPAELSRLTGISPASLSQYINGKNKPSVARVNLIASSIGVKPEALIKEPEPETDEAGRRKLYNLRPDKAAKLLGVGEDFIKSGLRAGIFPWGYAVKQSSIWTYYINSLKFAEIEGVKLT